MVSFLIWVFFSHIIHKLSKLFLSAKSLLFKIIIFDLFFNTFSISGFILYLGILASTKTKTNSINFKLFLISLNDLNICPGYQFICLNCLFLISKNTTYNFP